MRIEMLIVLDETGQVLVTGPIDQKLVCYGLLEAAKDAVCEHHRQAAQRLVQPAPAMFAVPKGS